MDILEQIKTVAILREQASQLKSRWNEAQETFNITYHDLLEQKGVAENELAEAEVALRELAVKITEETGDKKPAPGVEVKEVQKMDYDDKVALDWAKEHGLALKLDETKFKSIVKADTPDFVTITTEYKAYLSKDLDGGE